MKPICEIDKYGDKYWRLNSKLHREDGPAIEYVNGTKIWLLNGKWHREDGPAVEHCDGTEEWYYRDKYINCKNTQEFLKMVKLKIFL